MAFAEHRRPASRRSLPVRVLNGSPVAGWEPLGLLGLWTIWVPSVLILLWVAGKLPRLRQRAATIDSYDAIVTTTPFRFG